MMAEGTLEREFFALLLLWDEAIARRVRAGRCSHCGGPLHVGNYQRKPRGAAMAVAGEEFAVRHSLCCGWAGCRKRALPPSVRFFGRRVYLEVVVVFAAMRAQAEATLGAARAATQVPARTLQRWLTWWRDELPREAWWQLLAARFVPPPPVTEELPRSLIEKLTPLAPSLHDLAWLVARCLAPGTTRSTPDAASFVREHPLGAQGD